MSPGITTQQKKAGKAHPVLKAQSESCLIVSWDYDSAKDDFRKIGISYYSEKSEILEMDERINEKTSRKGWLLRRKEEK